MPAKSKAQQRFMGMVHAAQKGDKAASAKVAKVAKRMKKKDAEDYASTKHKGLPTKVKKEDLMRLISKYGAKRVKETIMAVRPKSVTVSGSGLNRKPEEPDFEYDPEDVDEGFGGELKGKDKKEFEKARKENAEQLGYKATGTSDTKKQELKMAHQLKESTDKLVKALKKKLSDEGGAAGFKDLKDTAKKMGIDLTAGMVKKMSGISQHRDGDYILESVDEAPITSPSQQPYSSPEAQKMAEKDIIGMSKILGKASQMSIKKMMDGVKSGKYDAFDLQRAIVSGPVRDTHTGERDFLRVLWNKVRSGFRRYSKRGKLR